MGDVRARVERLEVAGGWSGIVGPGRRAAVLQCAQHAVRSAAAAAVLQLTAAVTAARLRNTRTVHTAVRLPIHTPN